MVGAVVLIVFKRVSILKEVLESIRVADRTKINELVIIQQGSNSEIQKLLSEIDWVEKRIFNVDRSESLSSAQAINQNVHLGITKAFQNVENEFVSIIEDDICVSCDFFDFTEKVFCENKSERFFRGVNGFSAIPREKTHYMNYGKYRYGVGWGWSINRSSWNALKRFWIGDEDSHWDGLVEPFFKAGFVAAPGMSRIRNLGFDESATHTNYQFDGEIQRLESSIDRSYVGQIQLDRLKFVEQDLEWRNDCRIFEKPENIKSKFVHQIYFAIYISEILGKRVKSLRLVTIYATKLFNRILNLTYRGRLRLSND